VELFDHICCWYALEVLSEQLSRYEYLELLGFRDMTGAERGIAPAFRRASLLHHFNLTSFFSSGYSFAKYRFFSNLFRTKLSFLYHGRLSSGI
jgi:hypothetical protein